MRAQRFSNDWPVNHRNSTEREKHDRGELPIRTRHGCRTSTCVNSRCEREKPATFLIRPEEKRVRTTCIALLHSSAGENLESRHPEQKTVRPHKEDGQQRGKPSQRQPCLPVFRWGDIGNANSGKTRKQIAVCQFARLTEDKIFRPAPWVT